MNLLNRLFIRTLATRLCVGAFMPRFYLWLFFIWLPTAAQAHMLNMTEMRFDVSHQFETVLELKVDLGQSGLMTAEDYWAATQERDFSEQQSRLSSALDTLNQGIEVYIDGEQSPMFVRSVDIAAISLDAVQNPLTPQMATIRFDLRQPPISQNSLVEIKLAPTLDVPWPCLVRIDAFDQLPVSRLMTSDIRSSGTVALGAETPRRVADPWVALTLQFQSLLPAISWIVVGFAHILPLGLDHIVFVLGLFFLSTKFTTLLTQVTVFTVAHSLTLALATLGFVTAPGHIIEPLIAASIIYIAVDNLYADRLAKWRLLVVLLFGLLHGLGFASALDAVAMPQQSMLSGLLLFNLGVELGQITVLLFAYLGVGWLRRRSFYKTRIAEPASMTIAGVGLYWLIKRLAF